MSKMHRNLNVSRVKRSASTHASLYNDSQAYLSPLLPLFE